MLTLTALSLVIQVRRDTVVATANASASVRFLTISFKRINAVAAKSAGLSQMDFA